ncbi:hypothetical protein TcG_03849 [Trypanosoma cruzi]|nr:hypothetical protein TcG_03849 [Trypanosoma cruzi]
MVLIGGFTEWAHLRLRDHRPGPMSYIPVRNDVPERSILKKYPARPAEATVGPGEYQIPSTVGECRSTVFGPASGPVSAADAKAGSEKSSKENLRKKKDASYPHFRSSTALHCHPIHQRTPSTVNFEIGL